jgi:hypothetical protein
MNRKYDLSMPKPMLAMAPGNGRFHLPLFRESQAKMNCLTYAMVFSGVNDLWRWAALRFGLAQYLRK